MIRRLSKFSCEALFVIAMSVTAPVAAGQQPPAPLSPGAKLFVEATQLEKQGDLQGALRKCDQALSEFRRENSPLFESLVLKEATSIHLRLGNYQKTIDVGLRAVDVAHHVGEVENEMLSRSYLGNAYTELKMYAEGVTQFRAAFVLAQRADDLEIASAIADNLGTAYRRASDIPAALEWFERARAMKEQLGDAAGEAKILEDLTKLYLSRSDTAQALDTYRRRRALAERTHDMVASADLSHEIGRLAWKADRTDEAVDSYKAAAAAFHSLNYGTQEGMVLAELGTLYSRTGRPELAVPLLKDALSLLDRADVPAETKRMMQLPVAETAGRDAHSLRQYPASIEFYQGAVEAARTLGERTTEIRLLNDMSDSYIELGSFTKAIEVLQQARKIQVATRDASQESAILTNLAAAHAGLGQYETAKGFLREALAGARKAGNIDGEAIILNNLGDISRELGMYSEALELHNQSLPLMFVPAEDSGSRVLSMSLPRQETFGALLCGGCYSKWTHGATISLRQNVAR